MKSYRGIAIALFTLAALWLGGTLTFVARGIDGGQLQGTGPVIMSIVFAGAIPALFFGTLGAIFWRQGNIDKHQPRDGQ